MRELTLAKQRLALRMMVENDPQKRLEMEADLKRISQELSSQTHLD